MDLKTIAIYGLAGFGAYKLYENLTAMSNYSGTAWQRDGIRGTAWQDANTNFTGTEWQQAGRKRETMWQEGGVFQNMSGLQGTEWQTTDMTNACGSCS